MRKVSAHQIHESLKKLVKEERRISASVLDHLVEINDRKLFLKFGHDTLLKYCVRELNYSEAAAYRRIKAMKLINEVAGVREKLLGQELNLTQLCTAHSVFEEARKEEKIKLTEKEKLKLLKLIEKRSNFESENILRGELSLPEKRRVIRIQVSEDIYQDWIRLRGRAAHKDLTPGGVLGYAINTAIKELNGEEEMSVRRNNAKPLNNYRRHIPVRMRQRLLRKANYRCSYHKCKSSYALEIDHIKPMKLGGKTTEDNLRVLCRNHNQYMNELSA